MMDLGSILADNSTQQFYDSLAQQRNFRNQERADEAEYARGMAEGMAEDTFGAAPATGTGAPKSEADKALAKEGAQFKALVTVAEGLGVKKDLATTMSGPRLKGLVAGRMAKHKEKMDLAKALHSQSVDEAQARHYVLLNRGLDQDYTAESDLAGAVRAAANPASTFGSQLTNPQGPWSPGAIAAAPRDRAAGLAEAIGTGQFPMAGSARGLPSLMNALERMNPKAGAWNLQPGDIRPLPGGGWAVPNSPGSQSVVGVPAAAAAPSKTYPWLFSDKAEEFKAGAETVTDGDELKRVLDLRNAFNRAMGKQDPLQEMMADMLAAASSGMSLAEYRKANSKTAPASAAKPAADPAEAKGVGERKIVEYEGEEWVAEMNAAGKWVLVKKAPKRK